MLVALDVIIALICIYVIIDFIRAYATATGTIWERLLTVGKESATILWQRVVICITGLSGALVWLADWLNAPGIGSAIKSAIGDRPQIMAAFLVGTAIISEIARRRTL